MNEDIRTECVIDFTLPQICTTLAGGTRIASSGYEPRNYPKQSYRYAVRLVYVGVSPFPAHVSSSQA